MKFKYVQEIVDNDYQATVSCTEIDTTFTEAAAKFDNPVIDVGGKVYDTDGTTVLTTLQPKFITIPTDIDSTGTNTEKLTYHFRVTQYSTATTAEKIAKQWLSQVESKIETAITTLKNKTDTYTETREDIV